MHNAQCTMQNAECRMQNAQCRMHDARCTMQNARGITHDTCPAPRDARRHDAPSPLIPAASGASATLVRGCALLNPRHQARLVELPLGTAFPVLHPVRGALEPHQFVGNAQRARGARPCERPVPTDARRCRESAGSAASLAPPDGAANTRAASARVSSSSTVRPNRRAASDRGPASVTIGTKSYTP